MEMRLGRSLLHLFISALSSVRDRVAQRYDLPIDIGGLFSRRPDLLFVRPTLLCPCSPILRHPLHHPLHHLRPRLLIRPLLAPELHGGAVRRQPSLFCCWACCWLWPDVIRRLMCRTTTPTRARRASKSVPLAMARRLRRLTYRVRCRWPRMDGSTGAC